MNNRVDRAHAKLAKQLDLGGRHRDIGGRVHQKGADTVLGLKAFEKISAVEGVRLTGEMLEDLRSFDAKRMDAVQRSRFIAEKYGNKK